MNNEINESEENFVFILNKKRQRGDSNDKNEDHPTEKITEEKEKNDEPPFNIKENLISTLTQLSKDINILKEYNDKIRQTQNNFHIDILIIGLVQKEENAKNFFNFSIALISQHKHLKNVSFSLYINSEVKFDLNEDFIFLPLNNVEELFKILPFQEGLKEYIIYSDNRLLLNCFMNSIGQNEEENDNYFILSNSLIDDDYKKASEYINKQNEKLFSFDNILEELLNEKSSDMINNIYNKKEDDITPFFKRLLEEQSKIKSIEKDEEIEIEDSSKCENYENKRGNIEIEEEKEEKGEIEDDVESIKDDICEVKPLKNILQKTMFSPKFINRNVIIYPYKKIVYDTSFSSTFHSVCYSYRLIYDKGEIVDWNNLLYDYNELRTSFKISNNIYLNDNKYLIPCFDYKLDLKCIGTFPYELPASNYNFKSFAEMIFPFAISEYLISLFNIKIKQSNLDYPLLRIKKKNVYAIEHYSVKCLISQELPEKFTHNIPKEELEAFSHFSFILSGGKFIINDIIEYEGVIYDFQYREIENSYRDIFRFFYDHSCGNICKNCDIDNDNKEITDDYIQTLFSFDNYSVCELCQDIFIDKDEKKKNCEKCQGEIEKSKEKFFCSKCKEMFECSLFYYHKMKLNIPTFCDKCINLKI